MITRSNIARKFRGSNFMAPIIIGYGTVGTYYFELATDDGRAPWGKLFGVSIIDALGSKTDLGDAFQSLEDCYKHLDLLGEWKEVGYND